MIQKQMHEIAAFSRRNRKTGAVDIVRPARVTFSYHWNGRKVAWSRSDEGVVYLNSRYLIDDFRKTYFERMNESKYAEMWKELAEAVPFTDKTEFSEYMDA